MVIISNLISASYMIFFHRKFVGGRVMYKYDDMIDCSNSSYKLFKIMGEEELIYNDDEMACSILSPRMVIIYTNKPIKRVSNKLRAAIALQEF